MPRLDYDKMREIDEAQKGPSFTEAGGDLLRYIDRATRVAGLGVGAAGAVATAPLQVIPGVTDWLPEVDETFNAWRAFNEQRKLGDWDAGIEAAQDAFDAGPGYWGLSEVLGAVVPTGGPALAGSKLITAAPRLGRAAGAARIAGKTLRAPWQVEELVGKYLFAKPISYAFGKTIAGSAGAVSRISAMFGRTGRPVEREVVEEAMKALPAGPQRQALPEGRELLALPEATENVIRSQLNLADNEFVVTIIPVGEPRGQTWILRDSAETRRALSQLENDWDNMQVVDGVLNEQQASDLWAQTYDPEFIQRQTTEMPGLETSIANTQTRIQTLEGEIATLSAARGGSQKQVRSRNRRLNRAKKDLRNTQRELRTLSSRSEKLTDIEPSITRALEDQDIDDYLGIDADRYPGLGARVLDPLEREAGTRGIRRTGRNFYGQRGLDPVERVTELDPLGSRFEGAARPIRMAAEEARPSEGYQTRLQQARQRTAQGQRGEERIWEVTPEGEARPMPGPPDPQGSRPRSTGGISGDIRDNFGSPDELKRTSRYVNTIRSLLGDIGIRNLDRFPWLQKRTGEITGKVETLFGQSEKAMRQAESYANLIFSHYAWKKGQVFSLSDDLILDEGLQNIPIQTTVILEDGTQSIVSETIKSPTIQDIAARYKTYKPLLNDDQRIFMQELRSVFEDGTTWQIGNDTANIPGWNGMLRDASDQWDPRRIRNDIDEEGFFLHRGRVDPKSSGMFDEGEYVIMRGDEDIKINPRRLADAEKRARVTAQGIGKEQGLVYESFEDALKHHVLQTAQKVTGQHVRTGTQSLVDRLPAGTRSQGSYKGMVEWLGTDGNVPVNDELGIAFQREVNRFPLEYGGGRAINLESLNDFNKLYRSMKATGDFSHIGIQGMLAAYRRPKEWMQSASLAFRVMSPLTRRRQAQDILPSMISRMDANKRATRQGITSDIWASQGLRQGGTESEYTIPLVGRLAESQYAALRAVGSTLDRFNISFGAFGDYLRLQWADAILDAEIAAGRTYQDLFDSGDLRNIAEIANKMTGWSDTTFAGTTFGSDLGNMLLFAPRYFQSRLDTLGQAAVGTGRMATGRQQTIQSREAMRSIWRMIGLGVTMTMTANWAIASAQEGKVVKPWESTDLRPIVNGRYNPNFMRIRFADQDISLFGPWDSMLRMTMMTAGSVKDPSLLGDAYRGMSSGVVRAVWDNFIDGYTFTGERSPFTTEEGGRGFDPIAFAAYVGEMTVPISFTQAEEPAMDIIRNIPGAVTGEEGALGEIAKGAFGVAGEMTGARLTPLSRTDRYDEISRELYDTPYEDLDSRRKQSEVGRIATERYGPKSFGGPQGPTRQRIVEAETKQQEKVKELTDTHLSGEFGVGNWDPKSYRRGESKSMASMVAAQDYEYKRLYPDSEIPEPTQGTREHLLWQYQELFRNNTDSDGELNYAQLEEDQLGFWSKLSHEKDESGVSDVDFVLENIRVTEAGYPPRAQQAEQARRFFTNFKLNIRGEERSYWDLDSHSVVQGALIRAMPSGIGQDKVRQYLDSTSAERNGLLQGGERRLFEVIDKEYSKLFRKDGAMTSLRKDFVRAARQSWFPRWEVAMAMWDYQFVGDDVAREVIQQWTSSNRLSIDDFDFDALYRQTLDRGQSPLIRADAESELVEAR